MVQQAYDDAKRQLVEHVYTHYQPTYSMSATVRTYLSFFLDLALSQANDLRSYALEIGSNDGAVLSELRRRGITPIGLDPSADPEAASRAGYEVVRDYFTDWIHYPLDHVSDVRTLGLTTSAAMPSYLHVIGFYIAWDKIAHGHSAFPNRTLCLMGVASLSATF
jgi:hypothetical protein